ncbi:MAG: hypothetical protein ABL888_21190, partial [Pirellulaceae bacterium]
SCQGILVRGKDTEKLALDTSKQSVEFIGNILRNADELDVLLKGKYAGNHEFELHCSEFGKRLVADQVLPLIKNHYGFDPCLQPNDQSLVEVLKASPSAARFAVELKPILSDLVKRRLLATVVVAGFSRDCLQNPQLILKKTVRDAFRKVVELFTANYDRTIEFYEELALVGGFDSEQLSEIIRHSDEWMEESSKQISPDWADAKVSLSQNVAPGQPTNTTLFAYFLLAGIRSGNHVELRCNYDASITLDTSRLPKTAVSNHSNHEPKSMAPCSFAVGPGEAQRLPFVDLRCNISLSPTSRKLTLTAVELSDRVNHKFPLVLSLPRPDLAKEGKSKVDISFNLAKLTVGDALNLKRYAKLCHSRRNSEISVSLLKTGKAFVTLNFNANSSLDQNVNFPDELIERLVTYDKNLPLPWFIQKKHEKMILNSSSDSIGTVMAEIKKELQEKKSKIATIVLVQENEGGIPFREEWLGFFPGLNMEPPKMSVESNRSEYTASDIEELWNKREGSFKLETKLREDTVAIAKSFRDWADSEGKDDWPICIDSSTPTFHQAKTIFSMIRQPFVDRFWFLEAPDELVVRPTTHAERLETEMKYWASVGDQDREDLIEEKLARIELEENTKVPTGDDDNKNNPKAAASRHYTRLETRADKKRKRKLRNKQKRRNRK